MASDHHGACGIAQHSDIATVCTPGSECGQSPRQRLVQPHVNRTAWRAPTVQYETKTSAPMTLSRRADTIAEQTPYYMHHIIHCDAHNRTTPNECFYYQALQ